MILFFLFSVLGVILANETFNYDYLEHGKDWLGQCKTGKNQSPIDLYVNTSIPYTNYKYFLSKYEPNEVTANYYNVSLSLKAVTTFGITYAVSVDGNGNRIRWNAMEMRFKSPSEHTFNGSRYRLEIQIMNQNINNAYQKSVFSLFFNESSNSNNFLANIINMNRSNQNSFSADLGQLINIENSDDLSFWGYMGSLTYPTCNENIEWYIIDKKFEATKEEIDYFYNLYHNNKDFAGDGNYREINAFTGKLLYFK